MYREGWLVQRNQDFEVVQIDIEQIAAAVDPCAFLRVLEIPIPSGNEEGMSMREI